ncbi:swarming motility protein YbiA [Acrasis kona]|uniref:Swarming motility protein YbiA n=1 Tax=Acrasis kona TaxID=1008807 RepID=A0AAW2YZ89_9EUKA
MGGPALIDGKLVRATDNFHAAKFKVDGVEYYSSENYFQCAKCVDENEKESVRHSGTGGDVWMAGARVKLRKDWEIVKVREMYVGCKAKYEQNSNLKNELISTSGPITFSGSTWFWCKWNGKITELLREELKEPELQDESKILEIRKEIENYEQEQAGLSDTERDKKTYDPYM